MRLRNRCENWRVAHVVGASLGHLSDLGEGVGGVTDDGVRAEQFAGRDHTLHSSAAEVHPGEPKRSGQLWTMSNDDPEARMTLGSQLLLEAGNERFHAIRLPGRFSHLDPAKPRGDGRFGGFKETIDSDTIGVRDQVKRRENPSVVRAPRCLQG